MDSFEELRAAVHKETYDQLHTLLTEHLKSIHYTGVVQYGIDYSRHILKLYSQSPGRLIGKGGKDVDTLQCKLSDKFKNTWSVEFVEVHGYCINV